MLTTDFDLLLQICICPVQFNSGIRHEGLDDVRLPGASYLLGPTTLSQHINLTRPALPSCPLNTVLHSHNKE